MSSPSSQSPSTENPPGSPLVSRKPFWAVPGPCGHVSALTGQQRGPLGHPRRSYSPVHRSSGGRAAGNRRPFCSGPSREIRTYRPVDRPRPGMSDFLTTERLGPMQSLTPEGFLIIRAVPLARCGSQLYSDQEIPFRGDAGGRIVIDRLAGRCLRPATIAILERQADHSRSSRRRCVTRELPRSGSRHGPQRAARPRRTEITCSIGDLVITDPEAIKAIRDRELREVSVGYRADLPANRPRSRQADKIFAQIILALVSDGRCGPACRIGDKAYFTKDQAMDNLGPGGSQLRPFRLPRGAGAPSRDQGAQGSQGSTGTAYGGTARKAPPPSKPPGARQAALRSMKAAIPPQVNNTSTPIPL